MENSAISYVSSLMPTGESLPRKHLLNARGTRAKQGEIVEPVLDLRTPVRVDFMCKIVTQIQIGLTAKSLSVTADAEVKKSKYLVKLD